MARQMLLALAIHNHQPVGNFDWVFEEAYSHAYLPMIQALERHPGVRLALHYSGPLRDWLLQHHADFVPMIRGLVARGQVEIMTGGYYEPVLVALPERDQRGQIRKMTQSVRDDFGYEPTGLWLAERVWEPHLPQVLAQEGVRYTIVDDTHFKWVGLSDEDLLGSYITEEQGEPVTILGTSKSLRYAIPWHQVTEAIDWLKEQASEHEGRVAVMGDDGEKFGLWPQTYEHVWTRGWMEEFFCALEANGDWLRTIPPGDYVRQYPPIGRVYLPTASYDEMSEWALPAALSGELARLKHTLQSEKRDDILRFIRGGFWRSFLAKYPEVNTMHKKMLRVSARVDAMREAHEKARAQDALWAGQCNCPYWHGVFGGIYLPHIRTANYDCLLTAENLADADAHDSKDWLEVEETDFDRDGLPELLVSSSAMNLYFAPARGGRLFEWDLRRRQLNLLNTLSRRPEGYHENLIRGKEDAALAAAPQPTATADAGSEGQAVKSIHEMVRMKEPGLDQLLQYDRYQRLGLIDHFIAPGADVHAFLRVEPVEVGDFVDGPYAASVETLERGARVVLRREGVVQADGAGIPVTVEKAISVDAGETILPIRYSVRNTGDRRLEVPFGVEFNLALLSGHSADAYYVIQGVPPGESFLDSVGETAAVEHVTLVHEWLKLAVHLDLSRPARLWRLPVATVSNSEGGFERVYQASCLLPLWDLVLAPGETWQVDLTFDLEGVANVR